MPELPEVETIKNELAPKITGRRFLRAEVLYPRAVRYPSPEAFCQGLARKRVLGLERRGKYLVFSLEGRKSLIIHLRMTGVLLWDGEEDKYTSARFFLDGGSRLVFRDRRRLGALYLVEDPGQVLGRLGPEALALTTQGLASALKGRRAPLKALLLDQGFLAGLGNMYADEALFEARLHPLRPGGSLSPEEIARLHRAIEKVLRAGIAARGASVDTYRRPDGSGGWAHQTFAVAHLGGRPCPRCGTPIQRLVVRNRGSYFCPNCQK